MERKTCASAECFTYLDVFELLSEHRRTLVDGETGSIERSAKHLNADGHAHDITRELDGRANIVNVGGTFENLHTRKESTFSKSSHHMMICTNIDGR